MFTHRPHLPSSSPSLIMGRLRRTIAETISGGSDTVDQKMKTQSTGNSEHPVDGFHHSGSHHLLSADGGYLPDPLDAVDRPSVLSATAGYIIVTEFCERLAYYGFAGSLVLFFQTQLNLGNADADVQYSAWSGACYVTPLIGGYIADTYLGRYKSILVFCIIYVVGLGLMVLGSIPGNANPGIVYPAIYIVAIGTGGIKPNVCTMGAEQFDERYSQDRKEKESFFNWFYWSINLGAAFSYTLVSYICQYGIPQLGGKEWGFFVGYMIPFVMMGLAILVFLAGTPKYKIFRPQGSAVGTALAVCWQAVWTNRTTQPDSKLILDRSSVQYGGSFSQGKVDSVKLVTRLFPFLGVLVAFWGIYGQMSTAFQNQGCQMNLSVGPVKIPVSALNLFDSIAILVLVPIFDGYLYPWLHNRGRKVTMLDRMGWGFIFAMLSMVVAGLIEIYRLREKREAGDYYDSSARDNISPCQNLDDYNPKEYQKWEAGKGDSEEPANCHQINGCDLYYPDGKYTYLNLTCIKCDDIPQMSKLSVFWQIPQFCLIGVAEIFAAITSLEFFYSQAPTSMRSVSQALNLFTTALGSWLTIPLLILVNSGLFGEEWVPENLDDGHLSRYFFLLAGLMVVNQCVYHYISADYEYKTEAELKEIEGEEDDVLRSSLHSLTRLSLNASA